MGADLQRHTYVLGWETRSGSACTGQRARIDGPRGEWKGLWDKIIILVHPLLQPEALQYGTTTQVRRRLAPGIAPPAAPGEVYQSDEDTSLTPRTLRSIMVQLDRTQDDCAFRAKGCEHPEE